MEGLRMTDWCPGLITASVAAIPLSVASAGIPIPARATVRDAVALSADRRSHVLAILILLLLSILPTTPASARELRIGDVLDLGRIERVTPSPDGEWVAAVVARPARTGEIFGRTYYETDPSRNDVWLISRRTGERRNLTVGEASAAGFWCPTWSPDGRRMAMLSTKPEGSESRGGDDVRLYVWESGSAAPRRVSGRGLMTQTHYGSPMYRLDVRGGADGSILAHECSSEENAPFAWLDDQRLLVIQLQPGVRSGLLDEQARAERHAAETTSRLQAGREPTFTAVGSGAERVDSRTADEAELAILDIRTGVSTPRASLPLYPFRGELTVSVSPNGRRAAILATVGAIAPASGQTLPNIEDDSWTVEKRLGFVDLTSTSPPSWTAMPTAARLPLEFFGWSPDNLRVAFSARSGPTVATTRPFVAIADGGAVAPAWSDDCSIGGFAAGQISHELKLLWVDDASYVALGRCGKSGAGVPKTDRLDWWIVRADRTSTNLTSALPYPVDGFRRSSEGRFFAIADGRLLLLDPAASQLTSVKAPPTATGNSLVWPRTASLSTDTIVLQSSTPGGDALLTKISLVRSARTSSTFRLEGGSELSSVDNGGALVQLATRTGLRLRQLPRAAGRPLNLLSLDEHLADVNWGTSRTISYRGEDGQDLQAAVILPPGYVTGRRYPVVTWVYPGTTRAAFSYWLDPRMPGIYNLYLYAAQGYVVLIPEMPMGRDRSRRTDVFLSVTKGAIPAVDRLVELGIADADRVGVMGQSMGGYAVYSLVTQTTRFKAAIAVAGITDLAAFSTSFDPTARGYDGIEHERSYNWNISTYGGAASPLDDYWTYLRESPIAYTARVETPLLLIHGDNDARAPMSQAEAFFYMLYRQGKTAKILRYWGENHALARSPANVRSVFDESIRWFGKYLAPPGSTTTASDLTGRPEQAAR